MAQLKRVTGHHCSRVLLKYSFIFQNKFELKNYLSIHIAINIAAGYNQIIDSFLQSQFLFDQIVFLY